MDTKAEKFSVDEKLQTELKKAIEKMPRRRLANLPTPLEEAPRLSKALEGPRIYIKRDDLTGIVLSGNKTRMLEFSLAYAIEEGADTVVRGNYVHSNYLRQMIFACNRLGLESHSILAKVTGEEANYNSTEIQGNLLLELLGGENVELVETHSDTGDRSSMKIWGELARKKARELEEKGRKVYELRATDHADAVEALGYVNCALELHKQLKDKKVTPDYLVICSTTTSQTGLLVGAKYLGETYKIVSFRAGSPNRDYSSHIAKLANDVGDLLGLDLSFDRREVINKPDYVGERFGKCTPESLEAIKLVARTEGILLDPMYSGKAMAGLIDYVKKNKIKRDETVVFVHTGGFPLLFSYHKELADYLGGDKQLLMNS